jgi:peptide chain release factor 3
MLYGYVVRPPAYTARLISLDTAPIERMPGVVKVVRSGKELRPNTVVSFMSQRRELLDTAFAGDIIGIPNHGVLQLGDTLTEGEALQFTGLPFFAPEMFRSVEVADPLRSKQLRAGLTQLGEEGAIQVFRPVAGSVLLLGAVGQLQFEVVAHRLEHEYGVKARISGSAFNLARWVTSDDANELKKFIDANAHRVALDAVDAPTLLVDHRATLRAVEQQWPKSARQADEMSSVGSLSSVSTATSSASVNTMYAAATLSAPAPPAERLDTTLAGASPSRRGWCSELE